MTLRAAWRSERRGLPSIAADPTPARAVYPSDGLLQVAELPPRARPLVAELRMRDRDEPFGARADRAAPHLGDAVFGHHAVDDVLERGDGRPRVELGNDARDGIVHRRRVQDDERLPMLSEHGAAREVGLTARGGPVVAAQGFRRALSEEVHLDRR